MERYIGMLVVDAEPMTRGQYADSRGWVVTEDGESSEPGYRVVGIDGSESWYAEATFKSIFKPLPKECENHD